MAEPESKTVILAPLTVPRPNQTLRLPKTRKRSEDAAASGLIPLFYAAILFVAGIVLARFVYLRPGVLLVSLLPLGVVAASALVKAQRVRWLPMAMIWMVLGAWSAEMEVQPAPDPTIVRVSDGLLRTLEGRVMDAGPSREAQEDVGLNGAAKTWELEEEGQSSVRAAGLRAFQRVDLEVESAEEVSDLDDTMRPVPGGKARIRLSVQSEDSASGISCGDRVRVVARVLPPDVYKDPGVWSRASYLEGEQISGLASVDRGKADGGEPRFRVLNEHRAGAYFGCWINQGRNDASARLEKLPDLTRRLPPALRASADDAAMLTALLTGDRSWLTRRLRIGFERTGSFHLIVVSGLHLAILAKFVSALARRMRIPRVWATALTIAITLFYALFTGFGVPAQRSFWMVTLYLLGRLVYRDRSPLNVIGFAILVIAAVSPRSIFDASLQMTVLAVASIAGFAVPFLERNVRPWIKATRELDVSRIDSSLDRQAAQLRVILRLVSRHLRQLPLGKLASRLLPWSIRGLLRLAELIFVTLVVELALALPMAMYFHRITVYALPVNLLILPLLGLLVPLAMLMLLALAVLPAIAAVPAAACLAVLHLSVAIVRTLGGWAWSDLRMPEPAPGQVACSMLLFVLGLLLVRGVFDLALKAQRRLAACALVGMAICALWPRAVEHPERTLLFEAIDVGQGDSLLLISPEGKTLLVDGGGVGFAGPKLRNSGGFDVGEDVVSEVLWTRGIRRLDAVALTHAHHDHMGGLPAILRNFRPRELWVGNNPLVPDYAELLADATRAGAKVRKFHAGDSLALGSVSIRVLAPRAAYMPGNAPKNDDSLVMQARYGQTSVLLAGDAEAPEEQSTLGEDVLSTVLKVGHHGSLTSTRPEFLTRVQPTWAVISCGRRNRFGHPRPEILEELGAAGVRTFRTDLDGATCLVLDGKTVRPDPMCAASGTSSPGTSKWKP